MATQHPLPSRHQQASGRPLVIGHRGAPGYRPEHTASAYQLAFALGADAVEPDIVATRDGVLVLRHENEISGTTDVASRPEFAARRTTKEIDGAALTGWFTEDFTWEELSLLRARERIPSVRRSSATFDGRFGVLRLADLFRLIEDAATPGHPIGMVAEIKHASYFASQGLPLDELFTAELDAAGWASDDERLTVEAFELTVLEQLRERGVGRRRVFLLEASGAPYDRVLTDGPAAPDYADYLTGPGLRALAATVEGISVDKRMLLEEATDLVDRAHGHGLTVFTWTLRPENRFLSAPFRNGHRKADFGDWAGEFSAIMRTGVDGVFADHPDLAVEVRDSLTS